ncbi:hypothetical protein DFR86_04120 [Acidianus sulfidivorans JP7]|uniref:DUF3211 domain-containing protein n=1 Tax=Acidianus sulfidivorans JP7 TaxID=619593 RepID=A0A2U9ILD1_9CREN|nr:hypothetical protein [Acidianus sulfidivorans]AWR96821.1 hypothetical protein DFR86_04120 [Acidianus sulfidivorans JP7]
MEIYEIFTEKMDKEVINMISNPYTFAGITGHICITKVFDKADNSFKLFSEAKMPDLTMFQAIFVFDHESEDSTRGILKYNTSIREVSYTIDTFDKSIFGNIDIMIGQRELRFVNNLEIKKGFFKKKDREDLLKHILNDHIKPFLTSYGVKIIETRL